MFTFMQKLTTASEAPMMCDTDFLSDLLPSKSQASVFDTNLILCTRTSCVWKIKSSLFQMMPFITLKYRQLWSSSTFSMNMEQTHTISLYCQLSPTWAVIQYSCISHLTMKGGRKSSSYQLYVGPVGGTQVFLHDCRVKTNNSESPTQTLFKKPGWISPSQLCHEDRKKP